ncbi:hypothetical protein IWQ60_006548 [Tieghemiomyces parasiticus]|uniref:Cyclin-like domain-containing protein n=1 Tax=Tieghemiomyces parasiticus TaxID=78921 RepID=A0A9W8A433_9FUNG|nr:hypothetical protein IWQ60_006669 [Tieghemiomyces parasiticus]KAJ1922393.1 hypothetical protein IWQ60_006548 [Tieghemiomyces parasiticus]
MQAGAGQWYFKKEDFAVTPSSADGISPQVEVLNRAKACRFIYNVGLALRFSYTTIATACVLFHRFYMRNSMQEHHYYVMAGTCIYVASKAEEQQRKMRDVVLACARKAAKKDSLQLAEDSKEFLRWRDHLIYKEEILLEAVCFELTIQHPYKYLIQLLDYVQASKMVKQYAWAFVNDSFKSYSCLLYQPHVIAAAALYLAAKVCQEDLVGPNNQKRWWEHLKLQLSEVEDCADSVLKVHEIV